jgi:hypothetical protein
MSVSTAKLIPIANSILARQQELGDAIWTYLWVLDHITQVGRNLDGQLEALISDGQALTPELVAGEMGFSVGTVNRHLILLSAAGLIDRGPAAVERFAKEAVL